MSAYVYQMGVSLVEAKTTLYAYLNGDGSVKAAGKAVLDGEARSRRAEAGIG